MQQPTDTPKLADAYAESLPASRALYERAKEVFPDGVTHDNRRMQPFPIYVDRAEGAYKWDVDGNRYIDYWMGHGALLYGHNPTHIRDSVSEAVLQGSHYGASHRPEVEWGEWVQRLVPCAERVRFTASGTEATHMALRLARAFTGRKRVVKFAGHFHGWHEGLEIGVRAPYTNEPEAGQLEVVTNLVTVCPPDDIEAVREALASGDVAALILEPTGGHFGTIPMKKDFVAALREETRKVGALLVFDEVVTGFRVSPGGAQAHYRRDARPDEPRQDTRRRPSGGSGRGPCGRSGIPRHQAGSQNEPAQRKSPTTAPSTRTPYQPPRASPCSHLWPMDGQPRR